MAIEFEVEREDESKLTMIIVVSEEEAQEIASRIPNSIIVNRLKLNETEDK